MLQSVLKRQRVRMKQAPSLPSSLASPISLVIAQQSSYEGGERAARRRHSAYCIRERHPFAVVGALDARPDQPGRLAKRWTNKSRFVIRNFSRYCAVITHICADCKMQHSAEGEREREKIGREEMDSGKLREEASS